MDKQQTDEKKQMQTATDTPGPLLGNKDRNIAWSSQVNNSGT